MDLWRVSRVGELPMVRRQPVGLEKTFARSQLAAISSILMDFMNCQKILWIFMHFEGRRFTDGSEASCGPFPLAAISWIFDFIDLLGFYIDFHGSMVAFRG